MSTSPNNGSAQVETTLLSGRHFLFPKTKLKYDIVVTNLKISWNLDSPSGSNQVLHFVDILGCECMKGKSAQDVNAYITVYAYPHKKKFASKKTVRQRQTLTFSFDLKSSFAENSNDAEPWVKLINCLAKNVTVNSPGKLTFTSFISFHLISSLQSNAVYVRTENIYLYCMLLVSIIILHIWKGQKLTLHCQLSCSKLTSSEENAS